MNPFEREAREPEAWKKCNACHRYFVKEAFTRKQVRKGNDEVCCHGCVEEALDIARDYPHASRNARREAAAWKDFGWAMRYLRDRCPADHPVLDDALEGRGRRSPRNDGGGRGPSEPRTEEQKVLDRARQSEHRERYGLGADLLRSQGYRGGPLKPGGLEEPLSKEVIKGKAPWDRTGLAQTEASAPAQLLLQLPRVGALARAGFRR